MRVGEQRFCRFFEVDRKTDPFTVAGPVSTRGAGQVTRIDKLAGTGKHGQVCVINRGAHLAALADFHEVASQPETSNIGDGMDAIQTGQHRPRRIQLGRGVDHRLVITGVELILLQCGAIDANPQLLAENQLVTRLGARVALEVGRIDDADGNQPIDRLDRVDGMAAGNRNTGSATDGFATLQNLADGFQWQGVDRHADDGQRKEGRAAHGVDIGNGIGGRDTTEIVGIIDDGHEEVGRRDNRLLRVDLVDRSIVAGFGADQQLRRDDARRGTGENLLQDGRRNFASAAATMGQLGQSDFFLGHGCSLEILLLFDFYSASKPASSIAPTSASRDTACGSKATLASPASSETSALTTPAIPPSTPLMFLTQPWQLMPPTLMIVFSMPFTCS